MSVPNESPPTDVEPHSPDDDHPEIAAANARVGLWLFSLYCLFYGGFMALSAFAPALMARDALGGLNLAVLYGMGLIAAAVVLALVYMGLCRSIARRHASGDLGR